MAAPGSVLVIRPSAIGDVVMASGLIPAMRTAWPDAHIAWLAEPGVADLLRHNPRLDEVIIWPKGEWRRLLQERRLQQLWRAAVALRRQLRARRFDLVIDIQGLLKSGLLAWFSGGRERIGLQSREGSRHLMTRVLEPPNGDRGMSSEYRWLAGELGLDPKSFRLDLVPGEAAERRAAELLAAANIDERFVAVAPFTTRPQKHWFDERWVELCTRLTESWDVSVAILGGPGDRPAAESIAVRAGPRAFAFAGATRIGEAAALVSRSKLLVGVDTGLTHMGVALGVPTIALFGSTRPYLIPLSNLARVMYEPMPCSPCKRHPTCGGTFDCMRAHTVETVFRVGNELRSLSG